MNYGHWLSQLIDTIRAECRLRGDDETLEQAHIALQQACEEHKALLHWGDSVRAPNEALAADIREKASKNMAKVLSRGAQIAREHG